MSVECQVNVKSQSKLDIGGRKRGFNCLAKRLQQSILILLCFCDT